MERGKWKGDNETDGNGGEILLEKIKSKTGGYFLRTKARSIKNQQGIVLNLAVFIIYVATVWGI